MKKVGITLNILSMGLIHLICCGLPLIMALGGSIGMYFSLKSYTSWALVFHAVTIAFMIYYLHFKSHSTGKEIRWQRSAFWAVTLITLGTYLFTHSTIFKSEEEVLKQQQLERIFKSKRQ
jgi:hypothetical protein